MEDQGNDFELKPEETEIQNAQKPPEHGFMNRILLVCTATLFAAVLVGMGYAAHEASDVNHLSQANSQLDAELTQAENRLTALKSKLAAIRKADSSAAKPDRRVQQSGQSVPRRMIFRPHVDIVPAWRKHMQEQITDQAKELASTKEDLATTRATLQADLSSTQNSLGGLNGVVARNHAQLVALERLGLRDYYEFDLRKSRDFQREGPIALQLKHTSTKHQNYNVLVLVNDRKLMKKHVDLYEPIRFATDRGPAPLELVVNQITKNHVHGYVSVPKPPVGQAAATTAANKGPENATLAGSTVRTATPASSTSSNVAFSSHGN